MKSILSLFLVLTLLSALATAEPVETFDVTATLQSSTGRSGLDSEEVDYVFCRSSDSFVGEKEIWESVTLEFDQSTDEIRFLGLSSQPSVAITNENRVFFKFTFNDNRSYIPKDDFTSSSLETIEGFYFNGNLPSFRATSIITRTVTKISTGESARCIFKYSLTGGRGTWVDDSENSKEASFNLIQSINEKVRRSLIIDEGRSKNTERHIKTESSGIGVRG